MDVRKLISFGKGSYIISMPKSWIDKNNLKKGDLISISDDGAELVISANAAQNRLEPREIDIDAKEKDLDLLKAEIVSSYLNGYDTINILFDNKNKNIQLIKDVIRNLSGLEVMEQTSTRIVAKNLININEISIKNIIRRMDTITRAMIEDVASCYQSSPDYEEIYDRDVDINRLYYLGYRVIKNAIKNPRIAKSLELNAWELHSDGLIILRLEKIADCQKRIARYLASARIEKPFVIELHRLYNDISHAYSEVMKSYHSKDKKLAFNMEVSHKDRISSCNRFLERYTNSLSKSKDTTSHVMIAKIIENLKSASAYIRDIARTVICYE